MPCSNIAWFGQFFPSLTLHAALPALSSPMWLAPSFPRDVTQSIHTSIIPEHHSFEKHVYTAFPFSHAHNSVQSTPAPRATTRTATTWASRATPASIGRRLGILETHIGDTQTTKEAAFHDPAILRRTPPVALYR